jgi:hypothetical protein
MGARHDILLFLPSADSNREVRRPLGPLALSFLHSRPICGGLVRSVVGRAPHVLVETLAITGQVLAPKLELPQTSVRSQVGPFPTH